MSPRTLGMLSRRRRLRERLRPQRYRPSRYLHAAPSPFSSSAVPHSIPHSEPCPSGFFPAPAPEPGPHQPSATRIKAQCPRAHVVPHIGLTHPGALEEHWLRQTDTAQRRRGRQRHARQARQRGLQLALSRCERTSYPAMHHEHAVPRHHTKQRPPCCFPFHPSLPGAPPLCPPPSPSACSLLQTLFCHGNCRVSLSPLPGPFSPSSTHVPDHPAPARRN